MTNLYAGLDLGQKRDYTALAIFSRDNERRDPLPGTFAYRDVPVYRMQLVDRVQQTNYEDVVNKVVGRMGQPDLVNALLAVDETGVGAAVTDMLRKRGMVPRRVTITGGDKWSRDGFNYRIPKRDLATTVSVLLDSQRVKFLKRDPLTPILKSELQNFKTKYTKLGHDTYGAGEDWREGNNDDLVLAAALALWFGENVPTGSHIFQSGVWDGDVNSGVDARRVLNELEWED